ncbi:MAG: hypothetical protein IKN53_06430, partial [Oscillibacter sp.]|nr:hypothetical protein [Oscillibacter sp.]
MRQTTEYELPLWDADDRIRRQDFNAASEALDAALADLRDSALQMRLGSYEGNGSNLFVPITLGFSPKLLIIFLSTPAPTSFVVVTPDYPAMVNTLKTCEITSTGISVRVVGGDDALQVNVSGKT